MSIYNANFKDDSVLADLVDQIVKTYYQNYSKIAIDFNAEGYRRDFDKHIGLIGARIAMHTNTVECVRDGLFHEMSHFVYVNDLKKLKHHNFGLEYTTKDSLGYFVPTTWNGIKNELNVIVWQSLLCNQFNLEFNMFDFATALRYMDDFINVPLKGCFEHEYKWFYDRECTRKVEYKDKDNLRLESINDYLRVESMKSHYTLENLISRWNQRCQWVEKYFD